MKVNVHVGEYREKNYVGVQGNENQFAEVTEKPTITNAWLIASKSRTLDWTKLYINMEHNCKVVF